MRRSTFAPLLMLLLSLPAPGMFAPQTRERRASAPAEAHRNDDVYKVDVDLVVLDALVLQKKTGRAVGDLKRDDFILTEEGVRQQITHFSQDVLPLSVILLIDRGGCLDPFGTEVRRATLDALSRLKPADEVALMAYHDTVELVEGFSRDRRRIAEAVSRVPAQREHEEDEDSPQHCLDNAFYEAAQYMMRAGNPVGRRVILVITAVTSSFDCAGSPSGTEASHAVFESGSVVCGIIPRSPGQRLEDGVTRIATRVGGLFKAPYLSLNKLAEETGGEVLGDKPEELDRAYNTLLEHLRARYSMGFVPTNRKRDGRVRKLKLEVASAAHKARGKLVVKTRRGYVALKEGESRGGSR